MLRGNLTTRAISCDPVPVQDNTEDGEEELEDVDVNDVGGVIHESEGQEDIEYVSNLNDEFGKSNYIIYVSVPLKGFFCFE